MQTVTTSTRAWQPVRRAAARPPPRHCPFPTRRPRPRRPHRAATCPLAICAFNSTTRPPRPSSRHNLQPAHRPAITWNQISQPQAPPPPPLPPSRRHRQTTTSIKIMMPPPLSPPPPPHLHVNNNRPDPSRVSTSLNHNHFSRLVVAASKLLLSRKQNPAGSE